MKSALSGSKSRLRRRLYAAPNLRERRARFASGPLRKFLCSGPFLREPVCGTAPECPGRESLFRISQYRYAPPRGPAPTARLASSMRLVERLQRVRLYWSSHPPSAVLHSPIASSPPSSEPRSSISAPAGREGPPAVSDPAPPGPRAAALPHV